jgi:hypothetical protein
MTERETAESLGIRRGPVVRRTEWTVERDDLGRLREAREHENVITLSAGDDRWNCTARHAELVDPVDLPLAA